MSALSWTSLRGPLPQLTLPQEVAPDRATVGRGQVDGRLKVTMPFAEETLRRAATHKVRISEASSLGTLVANCVSLFLLFYEPKYKVPARKKIAQPNPFVATGMGYHATISTFFFK